MPHSGTSRWKRAVCRSLRPRHIHFLHAAVVYHVRHGRATGCATPSSLPGYCSCVAAGVCRCTCLAGPTSSYSSSRQRVPIPTSHVPRAGCSHTKGLLSAEKDSIRFDPIMYKGVQLDSGGALAVLFDKHHAFDMGSLPQKSVGRLRSLRLH